MLLRGGTIGEGFEGSNSTLDEMFKDVCRAGSSDYGISMIKL